MLVKISHARTEMMSVSSASRWRRQVALCVVFHGGVVSASVQAHCRW